MKRKNKRKKSGKHWKAQRVVELQEGKKRENRKEAMKSVWLGQKKMGIKRKTNC